MSDLLATQRRTSAFARETAKELALSADLAALADEDDRCIAIIARIYDMYDDQSDEIPSNPQAMPVAAEARACMDGRKPSLPDRLSHLSLTT